jgi:hypothetical protein
MLTTVAMRLPVWPRHSPARSRVAHPGEHRVDLGDHVLPVDHHRAVGRHAQGHVQHRPVLGDVDAPAGEHVVDLGPQAGPLG